MRERVEALIEVLVQRDSGFISALLEHRILEATLLNSDRTLTGATRQLRDAIVTLRVLCGRAPEETLIIDSSAAFFPATPPLQSLKQQAANTNFDLQQKRMQIARQGLKVDLT